MQNVPSIKICGCQNPPLIASSKLKLKQLICTPPPQNTRITSVSYDSERFAVQPLATHRIDVVGAANQHTSHHTTAQPKNTQHKQQSSTPYIHQKSHHESGAQQTGDASNERRLIQRLLKHTSKRAEQQQAKQGEKRKEK